MTKHRWIGLIAGIAVFLAVFGAALAATFFQASRQVDSALTFRAVEVLADESLGLYHDAEGTAPVEFLELPVLDLKPPLRRPDRTGGRRVFIRNQSDIALFLIEPCREVIAGEQNIGFMNPEIFDMDGNRRGNVCDRPSIRLAPGEMVRAIVNIHELDPNLEPAEYPFTAVFGAVGSQAGPSPVPAPEGMVSWWTADGHAKDMVGGNDGALTGDATFAEGMVGEAFSLDGDGDFVVVPSSSSLNPTDQITLDAWVKPTAFNSQGRIVQKGDSDSQYRLYYNNGSGNVFFIIADVGTILDGGSLTLDEWQHVAGTYDGTSMAVYVNGELRASVSASGLIPDSSDPLYIGTKAAAASDQDSWKGLIDEVEIFNRALSAEEIKAIYGAGSAGKAKKTFFNPSNGHYYQTIGVDGGIDWAGAKTAAEARTLAGLPGHLATITSQQENDFIASNFPDAARGCCWLGGFQPNDTPDPDANPAADWEWVTGEPFSYTNWSSGEPNDGSGLEDGLVFYDKSPTEWNDVSRAATFGGYVVEYEPVQ